MGPTGILIKLQRFSFDKMHWKMLPAKYWPFHLGLTGLNVSSPLPDSPEQVKPQGRLVDWNKIFIYILYRQIKKIHDFRNRANKNFGFIDLWPQCVNCIQPQAKAISFTCLSGSSRWNQTFIQTEWVFVLSTNDRERRNLRMSDKTSDVGWRIQGGCSRQVVIVEGYHEWVQ